MRLGWLIVLPVLAAGCQSQRAPIPPGWQTVRGTAMPATRPTVGHLQVFVCYSGGGSNHAALRVDSPDRSPLLFDPGGKYGTFPGDLRERRRCVIEKGVPTVEQYWDWRTNFCKDTWVEVFEWDLPAARANALWDALHQGSLTKRPFDPDYVGLACWIGVSEFLRAQAQPEVGLTDSYFIPANLAVALWQQRPSRVWEFRYPEGVACVVPPREAPATAGTD